jgi:hypothetical protein
MWPDLSDYLENWYYIDKRDLDMWNIIFKLAQTKAKSVWREIKARLFRTRAAKLGGFASDEEITE